VNIEELSKKGIIDANKYTGHENGRTIVGGGSHAQLKRGSSFLSWKRDQQQSPTIDGTAFTINAPFDLADENCGD